VRETIVERPTIADECRQETETQTGKGQNSRHRAPNGAPTINWFNRIGHDLDAGSHFANGLPANSRECREVRELQKNQERE
jgi:hypothetical protein